MWVTAWGFNQGSFWLQGKTNKQKNEKKNKNKKTNNCINEQEKWNLSKGDWDIPWKPKKGIYSEEIKIWKQKPIKKLKCQNALGPLSMTL